MNEWKCLLRFSPLFVRFYFPLPDFECRLKSRGLRDFYRLKVTYPGLIGDLCILEHERTCLLDLNISWVSSEDLLRHPSHLLVPKLKSEKSILSHANMKRETNMPFSGLLVVSRAKKVVPSDSIIGYVISEE